MTTKRYTAKASTTSSNTVIFTADEKGAWVPFEVHASEVAQREVVIEDLAGLLDRALEALNAQNDKLEADLLEKGAPA